MPIEEHTERRSILRWFGHKKERKVRIELQKYVYKGRVNRVEWKENAKKMEDILRERWEKSLKNKRQYLN